MSIVFSEKKICPDAFICETAQKTFTFDEPQLSQLQVDFQCLRIAHFTATYVPELLECSSSLNISLAAKSSGLLFDFVLNDTEIY